MSTTKTCPACGKKFECANSPSCWCAKLPPLPITPGKDCLCPECLEKLRQKSNQQLTTNN